VIRKLEDRNRAGNLFTLAFCPQGRYLVSTSGSSYALIWDFCDHNSSSASSSSHPETLEASWEALQQANPIAADRAIWTFVTSKDKGVRFLKEHFAVWQQKNPKRLLTFIQSLDHASFRVRKESERAIVAFGEGVLPDLQRYLDREKCTLELRHRIQQVIQTISAESLRESRAISALEYMGTEDARQVLTCLASSPPDSSRAKAAAGALRRLRQLTRATRKDQK
jgi:HEAT repeat protein